MLASPDNFYGQLHIASLTGLKDFLKEYSDVARARTNLAILQCLPDKFYKVALLLELYLNNSGIILLQK